MQDSTLTFYLAPALQGKLRKNQLAKSKLAFLPDPFMNTQPVVEKCMFLEPIYTPNGKKKQVDLCYNVGNHGNLVQLYLTQRKREDLEKKLS